MQFYKKGLAMGFISLLVFVIVSTILSGVVMILVDVPDEIVNIAGILILSVGCYSATYTSTQLVRNNGLMQGIMFSGFVSTVLFIACLIVNHTLTVGCFEKIVCCTLFSIIGGIKGINTKKTDERHCR